MNLFDFHIFGLMQDKLRFKREFPLKMLLIFLEEADHILIESTLEIDGKTSSRRITIVLISWPYIYISFAHILIYLFHFVYARSI